MKTTDETKARILKKFSRRTHDKKMTLMSPFVANKSRKTLFFHIAKTGGSAIHAILKKKGLDDGILSQKRGHYEEKLNYFTDIVEHWDEYYKFTMTRNKYALLVSNWNYDKKNLKLKGIKYTDSINHFRAFVKQIVQTSDENYGYWIDQYYITTVHGDPIFDFIGDYNNFERDLKIAMDHIGLKKYNSQQRINQVAYKKKIHFSEYYDQETKDIVKTKFKAEMDYFGYKLRGQL